MVENIIVAKVPVDQLAEYKADDDGMALNSGFPDRSFDLRSLARADDEGMVLRIRNFINNRNSLLPIEQDSVLSVSQKPINADSNPEVSKAVWEGYKIENSK
jgi:hypothetical protein